MLSVVAAISVLLLLALAADLIAYRQPAAVRHTIWSCAVLACLAFPGLRSIAPPRRAPPRAVATVIAAVAPARISVARISVGPERSVSASEMAGWLWLAGSLISAAILVADLARLRRLMRGARPLPLRLPVRVSSSVHAPGPFLAGFFDPVLVVPGDFESWPRQRRRAVLIHEFAHFRRGDALILLASRVLTIAYWFHPLCWLAARRMRAESERACDDAALRMGFKPSSYAGHLVSVARTFNPQPAIPMAAMSQLESRVKSILDPSAKRFPARRGHWAVAACLTLCAAIPLATLTSGQQPVSGGADVSGIVTDPSGARVPNATVIAFNSGVGNREVATTDPVGAFAFHSIPAGLYTIEVRAAGFGIYQQNEIAEAGKPSVVNPKLSIGGVTEKMSVVAQGTPRPQPQSSGLPVRVGGNIEAAKLLSSVKPVYPADLQAQGIEGTVLVDAVISKDGVPLSLAVRNTAVNREFADAALDAIRQWRYSSTLLNGEPVEVMTTATIEFKLKQ
jgi:TonB family protein